MSERGTMGPSEGWIRKGIGVVEWSVHDSSYVNCRRGVPGGLGLGGVEESDLGWLSGSVLCTRLGGVARSY
jgi:hypothetical protein